LQHGNFGRIIKSIGIREKIGVNTMSVVEAPLELVEAVTDMRFPARIDARLQSLMDRYTNGQLTPNEREDWNRLSS
jgi:hypothetical protein